jgi:hypothetical protein
MIEVERLKLELKHTLGMFAVAREEAMNAKITVSLSAYLAFKILVELNIRYAVVGTR